MDIWNPTIKVAARYPDVKFEHATGYKRPTDNISTYSARFYEGRHVIGKIAGRMTNTNIIGYIASFPIPEVIRGINAASLAARSVNPDIQIKIVWVYTWYDPGKEADAARALIAQGADIIMQHTDSTAPMTVAEEEIGVRAFGQASDMSAWGPSAHLTSIIDEWGPYYAARVQAVSRWHLDRNRYIRWCCRKVWWRLLHLENMPDEVMWEAQDDYT